MAIVAIVLMPFIGRAAELSGAAMGAIGGALLLLAALGGLVGVFGGRRRAGALPAEIERAVALLAGDASETSEGARRASAVCLLDGAYARGGGAPVAVFDPAAVAERIGPSLPYVERVERILVEAGEIRPVFTAPPSP